MPHSSGIGKFVLSFIFWRRQAFMIVDCRGHTRCSSELASTTLTMMTDSGDELSSACSLPSLHGGRERERRDRASVASVVLFPDTVLV